MKTPKVICINCGGTGEIIDCESGSTYVCEMCAGFGKIDDDTDMDDDSDERNFIGEE